MPNHYFTNPNGICEDAPCCGCCGSEPMSEDFGPGGDDVSEFDGEDIDDEPRGSHDLSDDADALASVGWGTDEDYGGCHGGDDDF